MNKNTSCCFTGHRIIDNSTREALFLALDKKIRSLIESGVTNFITGGALGFDTIVAETVLNLRDTDFPHITLSLALPCREQTKGWNRYQKEKYNEILNKADNIHYISKEYTPDCMMKRNMYMVDNSNYCIFYLLNTRSGTYKTVSYAMDQNLELINIFDEM